LVSTAVAQANSNQTNDKYAVRSPKSEAIMQVDKPVEKERTEKNVRKKNHAETSKRTRDPGEIVYTVNVGGITMQRSSKDVYPQPMDVREPNIKKSKQVIRCSFWPNCKNGDSCLFHHPIGPCKNFPACPFGERCLFIHPQCKYDPNCAKTDCPYQHSPKPRPCMHGFSCSNKTANCMFLHPTISCRYADKCTKPGCVFSHNPPCKNGEGCAKPTCPYGHPEMIVDTSKTPCFYGAACSTPHCKFAHPNPEEIQRLSGSQNVPSTTTEDENSVKQDLNGSQ